MGRRKRKPPASSSVDGGASSLAAGGASSPAPAPAEDDDRRPPAPPPSVDAGINSGLLSFCTSAYIRALTSSPATKLRLLREAADYACQAASQFPSSVVILCLHAEILFQIAAAGAGGYDEVVWVCDRALAVREPLDPAVGTLNASDLLDSPEARIESVLHDLRSLREMCCAPSSPAARVKHAAALSQAHLKDAAALSQAHLKDAAALSQALLNLENIVDDRTSRNESQNKTKTPEERRKEVEAQVAAARVLQWQRKTAHRLEESKKKRRLEHLVAMVLRKEEVLSYMKTLSITDRQGLLSVSISDLSSHISSFQDPPTWDALLAEAVSFAEANATFKFWACCRCNEKFSDRETHTQHIMQEHVGSFSPELQSQFPSEEPKRWIELQPLLPQEISKEWVDYVADSGLDPVDPPPRILSTDAERIKLLSRIQGILVMLEKHRNLCCGVINFLKIFARNAMHKLSPELVFQHIGLDIICLLDVPNLREVLTILQEHLRSCKLGRYYENDISAGFPGRVDQNNEVLKRLILESGPSKLLLDSHQFQGESGSKNGHDDDVIDAGPSPYALLSWITTESSFQEPISAWIREEKAKSQTSSEIIRILVKEFELLHELCEQKHKFLSQLKVYGTTSDEIFQICKELIMIDGRIMRTCRRMHLLVITIGTSSAFDYRSILMPLVKSFFLEVLFADLASEYSIKKADAAREALLKDLEDDDKKNHNKGGDHPKQAQGKSKPKKKNKKSRALGDKK